MSCGQGGGWGGDHGGIKMEWNRGVNCVKMGGGRMYIVYITSGKRTAYS